MAELQVHGQVLAWARTMRGINISDAAKQLGFTEAELLALESGRPKLKQSVLKKMARRYRVPYGSLFMPEPLPLVLPKQFRTLKGRPPQLSETTLLAWSDVNDAVDSFAELRELNPSLVPSASLPHITRDQDVEAVAPIERARLRITLAQQRVWSEAKARDGWRLALEAIGVFVYFIPMPRRDCMGFSVLDDRGIPAICVNDSHDILERQKTFTLIHEYCHLLLRQPGISDQGKGNSVERFCNQFAAAVLVPTDALRRVLPGGGPSRDWSTRELKSVANRFKVSMEVIALRIDDLEMAKPGFHDRKIAEWNALGLLRRRQKPGHPNVTWAERAAKRLGRKHARTVFDALDSGAINFVDARDLIGLSPRYFADVKAAAG